ncbi:MAG: PDZ domain-containing protein [Candidatus Binataceae bacterium]
MQPALYVAVLVAAAIAGTCAIAGAQSQSVSPRIFSPTPDSSKSPASESPDSTLEVEPRIVSPAPESKGEAASPDEAAPRVKKDYGARETSIPGAFSGHARPYLGISVRPALVRYHRQEIHGLEIVSVDPGSPAERAGLTAAGDKTMLGATGETATFLLGPVGLLTDRILANSGQLGVGGDMVVAVDDKRVNSPKELNTILLRLEPGETIWLTMMHITRHGAPKTTKIPVVLGSSGDSLAQGSSKH